MINDLVGDHDDAEELKNSVLYQHAEQAILEISIKRLSPFLRIGKICQS